MIVVRDSIKNSIKMQTLTLENADEVFSVVDNNRAYLRKWLPWVDGTDNAAVTKKVISTWEAGMESGTDYVFGIFKENRYIGNIGLHNMKKANNSGMIGYWLAEGEQGGGIITDCVRCLVDYGFNSLSLNRIYIHCAENNLKSRAVPERLGFALEGVFKDGECLYGQYFNLMVYGMLKRNWKHDFFACPNEHGISREEKAVKLFANGYNCAQAVLGAFCEKDGLDINTAFKLANGFGGGVRCGEICGAVSGAAMAIGLKCGFFIEKDFKQKGYCNKKTFEFMEKFKEENGSFICRDLLGIDIRCPDDHNTPVSKEAHKTVCPKLVACAVKILESMEFAPPV